jgi:hypothetical protein
MTDLQYHIVVDLPAPEGVNSYFVAVKMSPKDGACIVYGYDREGDIQPIEIHGSIEKLELPYCNPKIWIRYLPGLESFEMTLVGWKDLAELPDPTKKQH